MKARYEVVTIEEGCFGSTLASFASVEDAKSWIYKTGVADEHYYGVAIHDTALDLYDIGHREWQTETECWTGEGG